MKACVMRASEGHSGQSEEGLRAPGSPLIVFLSFDVFLFQVASCSTDGMSAWPCMRRWI
jgi:hypothetical protein